MKNIIFIGSKSETIHALKHLLMQRTQWCDYIDKVIKNTSITPSDSQGEDESTFSSTSRMNQSAYPFQISDIALPQDQTGCVFFYVTER